MRFRQHVSRVAVTASAIAAHRIVVVSTALVVSRADTLPGMVRPEVVNLSPSQNRLQGITCDRRHRPDQEGHGRGYDIAEIKPSCMNSGPMYVKL